MSRNKKLLRFNDDTQKIANQQRPHHLNQMSIHPNSSPQPKTFEVHHFSSAEHSLLRLNQTVFSQYSIEFSYELCDSNKKMLILF